MKRKLTFLLFGLLLAVGWTNVASAQPATFTAAEIANKTYTWGNSSGQAQTSYYINQETKVADRVTDPYQIYGMLKAIYMDKEFPGPFYNAYTETGQREDPTYYGGINGGWNIPFGDVSTSYNSLGDISINVTNRYVNTGFIFSNYVYYHVYISSIIVRSGNTEITRLEYTDGMTELPDGWSISGNDLSITNTSHEFLFSQVTGGSIILSSEKLAGYTNVQVIVNARSENSTYPGYIDVNEDSKTITSTSSSNYSWTIQAALASTTTTPTDVLISSYNSNSYFSSIVVRDANTNETLYSWTGGNNGATLPAGGYANPGLTRYSGNNYYMNGGGTIRIEPSKFEGHNSITVSVTGYGNFMICAYNNSWTAVNGTVSRRINFPAKVATDTYKPDKEGYTAVLVEVKNTTKVYDETGLPYLGAYEFTDSTQLIQFLSDNIKAVQLLTDGLRIGEGEEIGTVFNCSGTYNKFFFLGKGQARKKSSGVLTSIGNTTSAWPSYACEEGPFKFMFEQYSPTTGGTGDEIKDFYIEMMDGHVYNVVHDCASVIQNGHQFSMSGNEGTQAYAMSGLNFFIPDYRLKYWYTDSVERGDHTKYYRPSDGRDMNPYMVANSNTGLTGQAYDQATYFSVNYANYNKQHPPRVGIYLLTLDAEARPCENYANPGNTNYAVSLDWTSSLNEMSNTEVPQTYVIYEVILNPDGSTSLDSLTTVKNSTHYDFPDLFPQTDHSVTHTYIIMGTPTDNEHPSFIAWSNEDAVVIPGLNDFLMLNLDHYESDFDVPNMQNWYRNFLVVNNDGYVGLSTQGIFEGDSVFNLVRYENTSSDVTKQVAKLKFENMANGMVKYTVRYIDENGENTQQIEPDGHTWNGTPLSYQRSAMGIVDEGYLTIKADGDIIIQPNSYDVNFVSINVQAGSYNQTWTASQNTLPSGWTISSGSMWVHEEGANYLEGGGYILIPAGEIGNYTTATVTINAYGDTGKTAKIAVNGDNKAILNGPESARDYTWTITNGAKLNAPTRATTYYQKVTSTADLTDGEYLIVCENQGVLLDGSLTAFTGTNYAAVTFNNGVIDYTSDLDAKDFTIDMTQGYIKSASGYYIGCESGNNTITSSTSTQYTNTITVTNGVASITYNYNNANRPLKCNTTNNVFRYYKSTSGDVADIQLYKKVTEGGGDDPTPTEQTITQWNIGSALTSGWVLTPGSTDGSSGQGNGTNNDGSIWINEPGYITIPASFFDNYTDIRVEVSYAMYNTSHTGGYVSVNGVNGSASSSTSYNTYTWTDVDASNGIVIAPNTGWLNIGTIKVYGTPKGEQPPTPPSVQGVVRIANLRLVDQFKVQIPDANNHPYRYTYILKRAGNDKESSYVPVPVQHTGAEIDGYYTHAEMKGDINPTNFLETNIISAELDMNLSPTSAPYYYTVNSVENGVPESADEYESYLRVLQRRSAGDYQERQAKYNNTIANPDMDSVYTPGEHNFFDYRKIVAPDLDYFVSYAPIIWTNGIARHYYVQDTLNNSYGAPIWKVRRGDVTINKDGTVCQKQARKDANGNWVWNNSVNYTLDGTDYCLYFVSVDALGVLPVGNVEYEPYMFRLWLVDSTASIRNYTWELNDKGKPVKIVDDGPYTENDGMWKLLDTKMCENWHGQDGMDFDPDLNYVISIVDGNAQNHSWSENIAFVGPMNGFTPKLYVRFYYKIKGSVDPTSGMRGAGDDDNVGYVVVRGHNPDPGTAVHEIVITGEVESQTFYNIQGVESDKPFEGINIVVTRYSNGATTTTKVRY